MQFLPAAPKTAPSPRMFRPHLASSALTKTGSEIGCGVCVWRWDIQSVWSITCQPTRCLASLLICAARRLSSGSMYKRRTWWRFLISSTVYTCIVMKQGNNTFTCLHALYCNVVALQVQETWPPISGWTTNTLAPKIGANHHRYSPQHGRSENTKESKQTKNISQNYYKHKHVDTHHSSIYWQNVTLVQLQ